MQPVMARQLGGRTSLAQHPTCLRRVILQLTLPDDAYKPLPFLISLVRGAQLGLAWVCSQVIVFIVGGHFQECIFQCFLYSREGVPLCGVAGVLGHLLGSGWSLVWILNKAVGASSSYFHDRTVVRSGTGTPQVPRHEWYRNWPTES